MPIAVTDVQRALAESIADWADRVRPIEIVRAAQAQPPGARGAAWSHLADLGVFGIAVPEELGGAGGSIADAAAAIEQTAAALVPGPVLPTALAAVLLSGAADSAVAKELVPALVRGQAHAAVALAPRPVPAESTDDGGLIVGGDAGIVLGADADAYLLLSATEGGQTRWFVLPRGSAGVRVEQDAPLDFSRAAGRVVLAGVIVPPTAIVAGLSTSGVRDLAATFAAAEAAGVAGWCLRTASEYAGVREQFGRKIGSFQAIKHLCANALCRAEQAAALVWDAARAADDGDEQFSFAASIAAAGALDAAVGNAKDCIQVLGGIGFTWEHDAHLYLRRAVALRQLLGGSGRWRRRTAGLALSGTRRRIGVDVDEYGVDQATREAVRVEAAAIAELPEGRRRARLVESGYLVPHWQKPFGLEASPALQLVIDSELDQAGVSRPNLVIGGWATATILRHGTPEQQRRFIGPTLRGELSWCQLFSEPEAGSDLASLRTKAARTDGGWLLTGQKVWTSLAQDADWAICLARTDPDAPKHKGITYFLVDMRAAGIDIRPLREITGEERFNELFLSDVFVPDADVVGDVNGGWRLARTTLANERVAMSGGSTLGEGMERLLAHVQEHQLAETHADEIGRLIVDAAGCAVLDLRSVLNQLAGRPGPESSVRKLVGVQHRQDLAEFALELLGPDGATETESTHDVQHEFLLSRCLSIAGGTTQVLLNVAAERLLGLPRA